MALKKLCSAATIAIVALCCVSFLRAQDDEKKFTDEERAALNALSTRSIRPYRTDETPANKAVNIYDDNTDDGLNYFRDELDAQGKSTREKKREAEREARVRYADPMDKPAEDGSKFVDIFDESEVYADGEKFVDPEDPDVKYEAEENNILARADEFFQNITRTISFAFGVGSGSQNGNASGYGSSMQPSATMDMGMITSPAMMDSSIAPGGGISGGGPGAPGMAAPKEAAVTPSANDDTEMLFTEKADNPFKAEFTAEEGKDFDLFKADREFKPKPPVNQNGMGGGMYGPGVSGGNATSGTTPIPMGVSSDK